MLWILTRTLHTNLPLSIMPTMSYDILMLLLQRYLFYFLTKIIFLHLHLYLINYCRFYCIFFLIVFCQMEMEDPRKAGKLKEKALKESEKLKKNFKKLQQEADKLILKEEQELEQSIKRMQMEGNFKTVAQSTLESA